MTAPSSATQPVIAVDQLLTLALNALDNYFFRSHKEKARKLYKEIAAGDAVEIATLTFKEAGQGQVKLKLALDHSQYKGHITFHMFKLALQQTLRNIAGKLSKKQDLNLFTSEETAEVIVHLPGIIRDRDNINVMVLGIHPQRNVALIKLQFLDSDQFRKDSPEAASMAVSASDASLVDETEPG
ncbi:MAG: hypothetical protein WC997_15275 [Porticoccaceae bacterium]